MAAATIFALATPPAFAESRAAQPETAEAPSAAQQAQALFKEGATLYKMSDYTGALDKFTSAFKYSAQIEDDDLRGRVLHALQFNLARAHVKTYAIDEDVEHLRIAVDLLEKYLSKGAELGIELEAETLVARAKAELNARKEADAQAERARDEAIAPQVEGEDSASRDKGAGKSGRPLVLAGYGSLGLAGASLGLMAGGLVMANAANKEATDANTGAAYSSMDKKGVTGNALFYAGVAGAVVFAGTGVALLVLGKKRSKRDTAMSRWAPVLSPQHVGLQLQGSF